MPAKETGSLVISQPPKMWQMAISRLSDVIKVLFHDILIPNVKDSRYTTLYSILEVLLVHR